MWLRQSTTVTIQVGPYVDATDGVSPETALSPTIYLSKAGAAQAARNSATAITHDARGHYRVELNSTDTGTVGPLRVVTNETGAAPVWQDYIVLPANVCDSLMAGTDLLDINVSQFGGTNGTFASGRPETNATHWGGTAVASANVRATLEQILGTAITEGASGRVAAAFQTLFNVASPVLTAQSVNQTGDSYARLGAPAGASVSADVAAIKTDTGNLVTRITSTLFSGITSMAQWLGLIAGKQTGNSTARTELRATGAGSGTFDETTDSLEAIRDASVDSATLVDAIWDEATSGHSTAGTTGKALTDAGSAGDPWATALPGAYGAGTAGKIVGDNLNATVGSRLASASYTAPLDAAGTRTALGLASANLDTQLSAIDDFLDTEIASIASDLSTVLTRLSATRAGYLDNLSGGAVALNSTVAKEATVAALNNISTSQVLTQVNAALDAAISELTGVPSATPSTRTALMFLYMALRNRTTTTATAQTVQNDAGTTIATSALSDDGVTMTKGEFA